MGMLEISRSPFSRLLVSFKAPTDKTPLLRDESRNGIYICVCLLVGVLLNANMPVEAGYSTGSVRDTQPDSWWFVQSSCILYLIHPCDGEPIIPTLET